jgi:hypothetical protein
MTTRTITFKVCDGCRRNTYADGIEIVKSQPRWDYPDAPTIDICSECADTKFICRWCKGVHDDAHPCDEMTIIMGIR